MNVEMLFPGAGPQMAALMPPPGMMTNMGMNMGMNPIGMNPGLNMGPGMGMNPGLNMNPGMRW